MNSTNQTLASQQRRASTGARILVGTCLNARTALELLSWAIDIAACPGDTITALHVLVKVNKKKQYIIDEKSQQTMLRQAKTFLITTVAELADLYQSKQVKVEAKVRCSPEVGRGLVDEATSRQAAFLILGRSKFQRPPIGISTYCYQHAPDGCTVIAVQKKQVLPVFLSSSCPSPDSRSGSICIEAAELQTSKSKDQNKDPSKSASSHRFDHHKIMKGDMPYCKHHYQCNHRNSTYIATQDDEIGLHDKTLVRGQAHSTAESFGDFEPLPTIDSKGGNRLRSWKHRSPSKLFSFSLFQSVGQKAEKSMESEPGSLKPTWRCFSYHEIFYATNNFHPDNLVGRGGYSEVYRGQLHDGKVIAVKSLTKNTGDEKKEREFLTELGIMGHVQHRNATSLLGCCIEKSLHLIFELSPNGSLESMLHGKDSKLLEWSDRFRIAVGVARGLQYLHECCKRRIIHRDIKASNILLGKDFEPQISDFGLAKWLPKQWSHHSVTPVEGTLGYLAPEYFMHGIVDEKTDVFSYGILLLEIVTGRKPVDVSKQNLLQWAKPLMESQTYAALADPKLDGLYDDDQMRRVVLAAAMCVAESPVQRPCITEVIQILTDGPHSQDEQSWRDSAIKDNEISSTERASKILGNNKKLS